MGTKSSQNCASARQVFFGELEKPADFTDVEAERFNGCGENSMSLYRDHFLTALGSCKRLTLLRNWKSTAAFVIYHGTFYARGMTLHLECRHLLQMPAVSKRY